MIYIYIYIWTFYRAKNPIEYGYFKVVDFFVLEIKKVLLGIEKPQIKCRGLKLKINSWFTLDPCILGKN